MTYNDNEGLVTIMEHPSAANACDECGVIARDVDDCSSQDCPRHVCNACGMTCRICGARYCRSHTRRNEVLVKNLCSDCWDDYRNLNDGSCTQFLIEVEARLRSPFRTGRLGYLGLQEAIEDIRLLHSLAKALLHGQHRSGHCA